MSEMTLSRPTADDVDQLYRDHATRLLQLAILLGGSRELAEELVHEAFLRFHRSAVPQAGKELAYLRATVVNLVRSHHRRRWLASRSPEEPDGPTTGVDEAAVRNVVSKRVASAIKSLPTRQRECVVLHYFDELSDTEISAVLEISAGSVKTHLHRARARLREVLEDLA